MDNEIILISDLLTKLMQRSKDFIRKLKNLICLFVGFCVSVVNFLLHNIVFLNKVSYIHY